MVQSKLHRSLRAYTPFFIKNYFYDLLSASLLIYLFFVALSFSDSLYILSRNDVGRNFAVAKHMLQFKEFIPLDPWLQGSGGSLRGSPLYYYVLSLILIFRDDFLFLKFVNVILQIATLVLIYQLVKRLFNPLQGFTSVFLIGLSQFTFVKIAIIWNVHIMPFFLYASFLSLLYSYIKNNYPLLLLSTIFFSVSLALHISVVPLLPIYLILVFIILMRQKTKFRSYLLALLTLFISSAIFYLPPIVYQLKFEPNALLLKETFVQNTNEFTKNLINNLSYISFYPESVYKKILILFLILSTIIYFLLIKNRDQQKRYITIMLYAIITQTIIASLLNISKTVYLIGVYPLIPIIFTEVISTVFRRRQILIVVKVIIIFFLLRIITHNYNYNYKSILTMYNHDIYISNIKLLRNVPTVLKKEIYKIKEGENFKNISFFNLKVYSNKESLPSVDDEAINWSLLEKDLTTRFVLLNYSSASNYYEIINDDKYIFVICQYYNNYLDINKYCLNTFSIQYPRYVLIKKIYSDFPLDIYEYKRFE